MVEPSFQMEKDLWANEASVSPRPPPTGQVETIWGSPLSPQMGTEPRGYTDHLSVTILDGSVGSGNYNKVISSGSSAEASGIPEFQIAHSPPWIISVSFQSTACVELQQQCVVGAGDVLSESAFLGTTGPALLSDGRALGMCGRQLPKGSQILLRN